MERFVWADVESDDEFEPIEEEEFEEIPLILPPKKQLRPQEEYCCRQIVPDNQPEFLTLMLALTLFQDLKFSGKVFCRLNELRSASAAVHANWQFVDDEQLKFNLSNDFLKSRHEVFHLNFLNCLGIDTKSSDVKFNSVLPIESSRSPDYIKIDGVCVYIVELTVGSYYEKSLAAKGDTDSGYQSKYTPEINELIAKGYKVRYFVLAFEMRGNNKEYQNVIKKIAEEMTLPVIKEHMNYFETIRNEMSTLTRLLKPLMSGYWSLLFVDDIDMKFPYGFIDEFMIDEPYEECYYQKVTCSSKIYNSLKGSFDYLLKSVERMINHGEKGKQLFVYDVYHNRFSFNEDANGHSLKDWLGVFESRDYKTAISHMVITRNRQNINFKMKSDVEYFVRIDTPQLQSKIDSQITSIFEKHPESHTMIVDEVACSYDIKLASKVFIKKKADMRMCFEDEGYEDELMNSIAGFDSQYTTRQGLQNCISKFSDKMMIGARVNDDTLSKATRDYSQKLRELNDPQGEQIIVPHQRQPFLYPMVMVAGYCSYQEKPHEFLDTCAKMIDTPYTKQILTKAMSNRFTFGTVKAPYNPEVEAKLAEVSKLTESYRHKIRDECKKLGVKKLDMKKFPEQEEQLKIKAIMKSIKKSDMPTGRLPVIKMSSNPRTITGKSFHDDELSHFKTKKSKSCYKGVGLLEAFADLSTEYESIKEYLLADSGLPCPEVFIDESIGQDVPILQKLKEMYLSDCTERIEAFKRTNLYHMTVLITRFCHTLMYYSQLPQKSTMVSVDTLGVRDFIVLIRGGEKVFRTKKSKMYRYFCRIPDQLANWYNRRGLNSDFKVTIIDGKSYLSTPWQYMNETVMTDGMCALYKIWGFVLLSNEVEKDPRTCIDKSLINCLLFLHNRRKTEVMLHNLRYVTFNTMADFAKLEKILPTLAGFNTDSFQSYLRQCISERFDDYSKRLREFKFAKKGAGIALYDVKSLFNNNKIDDNKELASNIYASYLMSKAPVNSAIEQVNNLRGILEIKEEFDKYIKNEQIQSYVEKHDVNIRKCNGNFIEYAEKLMENDFKFDASYICSMGHFMADYLVNLIGPSELHSGWLAILNKGYDTMANTSGLRSDIQDEFFNQKGHTVVYKDVLLQREGLKEAVDLIDSPLDENLKRNSCKKGKITFLQRIKKKYGKRPQLFQANFHVVDKQQKGGGREIYVMDLDTKTLQQPIESFVALMNSYLPTEFISVPSNKRLQLIHSLNFEGLDDDEVHVMNWVLDCKKWAPKALIFKFVEFIWAGRSKYPPSFVDYVVFFFERLHYKRVYIKDHIYDIMKSNHSFKEHMTYFVRDEGRKGYYMEMGNSWMMGIFNHLSSMMHAANTIYANFIISTSAKINWNEESHLKIIVHSDDSGGKTYNSIILMSDRQIFMYEVQLHACNHLISDKKFNLNDSDKRDPSDIIEEGKVKSVIRSDYLEILSILYLDKELLPLLPKILGGFNFHPTDKGFCFDICESYSKCIDFLLNGATHQQAYLAMKIFNKMIHRFYFTVEITDIDRNLPCSFFGLPDAHPLLVLLCGTDSDNIRLYTVQGQKMFNMYRFINLQTIKDDVAEPFFINMPSAVPNVKLNPKLSTLKASYTKEVEKFESLGVWPSHNLKTNNSFYNALQFLMKLSDKNFISALQDETVVRRISRAYWYRKAKCYNTKHGRLSAVDLRDIQRTALIGLRAFDIPMALTEKAAELAKCYEEWVETDKNIFRLINSEPMRLMDYFKNIKFGEVSLKSNKKTTKPVTLTMQKNLYVSNTDYLAANLVIWMKDPENRWLIENFTNYNNSANEVQCFLTEMGVDYKDLEHSELFKICSSLKEKNIKSYSFYSNMPSQLRNIGTYSDFLQFLSHNSFRNKQIEGLVSPFGKTVNAALSTIMPEFDDPEVQADMSFLFLAEVLLFGSEISYGHFKGMSFKNKKGKVLTYTEYLTDLCTEISHSERLKPFLGHLSKLLLREDCGGITTLTYDDIADGYFHCFVKSQAMRGNVWIGHGRLFISLGDCHLLLHLNGRFVECVTSDCSYHLFDNKQLGYIEYIMKLCEIDPIRSSRHMVQAENYNSVNQAFGLNKKYQLCIDEEKNLSAMVPEFVFDTSIEGFLSVLKSCEYTPKGRNKYDVKSIDPTGHTKNYVIQFLPVEASSVINRVEEMTNIPENDWLTSLTGEEDFVTLFCRRGFELPLYINRKDVYMHSDGTKLYEIMQSLAKESPSDKCVNKLMPSPIYPAPIGGMLNLLIKYKELCSPMFQFNWQTIVSPELMALRANQPEAFVVNLLNNVKEKYNKLYNSELRSEIESDMVELIDSIKSPDNEIKILKVLKRWGNIGVTGALEDLKLIKSSANFTKFCFLTQENPYLNFYKDALITLLKAIYECNSMPEIKPTIDEFEKEPFFRFKCDRETITKSMVYQTVVCLKNCNNEPHSMTIADLLIYKLISSIFNSDKAIKIFTEVVEGDPFLCNLPIGDKHIIEWCVAYNACKYNTGLLEVNKGYEYDKFRDLGDNPAVTAQEFLEKMNIRTNIKPFYGGSMPPQYFKKLKDGARYEHKRMSHKLRCTFVDEDIETVPLVEGYIIDWPLSEDYIDGEDWCDLKIELTSDDPDTDVLIEKYPEIEFAEPTIPTKRYLTYKGKKAKEIEYTIKLLYKPDTSYDNWQELVTQLGDCAAIITNSYHPMMSKTNYTIYKLRSEAKIDCMTDKGFYLLYFRCRDDLPIPMIESFFECNFVDKRLLDDFERVYKYKHQFWGDKITSDEYMDFDEKNDRLIEAVEKISNPKFILLEEPEKEEAEAEMEGFHLSGAETKIRERMKEMGFSNTSTDQLLKKWKLHNQAPEFKTSNALMKNILDGKFKADDLKEAVKKVLGKVQDRKDLEQINLVPAVFGQVRDNTTMRRSTALKDPELIAEINSLSEDVLNKLLSGTLTISQKKKKYIDLQCKLWNRAANNRDLKKRVGFITRVIYSILADTVVVNDSKDDNMWRSLEENCQEVIMEDIEKDADSEDEDDFYDTEEDRPIRLKYKRMAVV